MFLFRPVIISFIAASGLFCSFSHKLIFCHLNFTKTTNTSRAEALSVGYISVFTSILYYILDYWLLNFILYYYYIFTAIRIWLWECPYYPENMSFFSDTYHDISQCEMIFIVLQETSWFLPRCKLLIINTPVLQSRENIITVHKDIIP